MSVVKKLLFISLCVFSFQLYSQEVTVTATVDSNTINIGDWIKLAVKVQHPAAIQVQWQQLRDTLDSFEIVQQDTLLQKNENGIVTESKTLTISNFNSGTHYVPSVSVYYRSANDTALQTAQSNRIPVDVRAIQVDTSQAIKDIKPPLSVPLSVQEILFYLLIILAIAGIGYGIYYFMQKRKQNVEQIIEEKPFIPAHILATQRLNELEAKRLWQNGEIKLFYIEATEIIRQYFEGRYGITALEMTTDEVLQQLEKFNLEKEITNTIHTFLSNADLVKFAKYLPIMSENEMVLPQAHSIIEKTKPIEVAAVQTETNEVTQNV